MMKLLVIAGWLAVAGCVAFHFRRVDVVRDYFAGFRDVWLSLFKAEDLVEYRQGAYQRGAVTAGAMIFVFALAIVVLAIVTVCLA